MPMMQGLLITHSGSLFGLVTAELPLNQAHAALIPRTDNDKQVTMSRDKLRLSLKCHYYTGANARLARAFSIERRRRYSDSTLLARNLLCIICVRVTTAVHQQVSFNGLFTTVGIGNDPN